MFTELQNKLIAKSFNFGILTFILLSIIFSRSF